MLAGTTIWSTHFIAMLAYDPGVEHAVEITRTALSLAIAVVGIAATLRLLSRRKGPAPYLVGGAAFGLTLSLMHYIGMSAYLVPGRYVWDIQMVIASVIVGALFATAGFHRVFYPNTKYCWAGAAMLFTGAITSLHFTGMASLEIVLDSSVIVPPQAVSDMTLGILVLFVTTIIYVFGFASFRIETAMEDESIDQLKRAAQQDPLTGLPNRMTLNKSLAQANEQLKRDRRKNAAVLTIDLNRFKQVNDLHGHVAGDLVLTTIADRLSQVMRTDEFVARTGGDEFVALMSGVKTEQQVLVFAQKLHALIVRPIENAKLSLNVGASIGIATSLNDGRDLLELQHKSDLAMYSIKADPTQKIGFYNEQIEELSREKNLLINDLRQALEHDEFELNYQKQNDLETLEVIGFEALLRWTHPERGPVSPAQFIPIAEETGLIRDIGLWVLRTACFEAAQWPDHISVAVNVAPQQLVQPSFLENVSDILLESQLSPERLEIEITEASIIDDQNHTLKIMKKLKAMGVRIAMDDFGTGYSSLATLQAFPFDKIKIDRSFIENVHQDHQRAAIVRSTLILGTALQIPVLAEGVEDQSELDFLRSEHCSSVQGFYFGKPMSQSDVRALIDEQAEQKAS